MRSTAQSAKPMHSSAKAVSASLRSAITSAFSLEVTRMPFSQQTIFMMDLLPAAIRALMPSAMGLAMRGMTTGPTAVVTRSQLAMAGTMSGPMEDTALMFSISQLSQTWSRMCTV